MITNLLYNWENILNRRYFVLKFNYNSPAKVQGGLEIQREPFANIYTGLDLQNERSFHRLLWNISTVTICWLSYRYYFREHGLEVKLMFFSNQNFFFFLEPSTCLKTLQEENLEKYVGFPTKMKVPGIVNFLILYNVTPLCNFW